MVFSFFIYPGPNKNIKVLLPMSGSITTNKEIGCPVYSIGSIFTYDIKSNNI